LAFSFSIKFGGHAVCALFPLPVKVPKEVPLLQASKWIKHPVLLSFSEMQNLLKTLFPVFIALVSEPVEEQEMLISHEIFLSVYKDYIRSLEAGQIPDEKGIHKFFSSIWTSSIHPLYAISAGKKFLVKSQEPVIQLQRHHFFYSELDQKIHSMVMSPQSIPWGIQFAYPQLFQDPISHEIRGVKACLNAPLFLKLARWMRTWTVPTPLILEGKLTYVPLRIGKEVLPWIGRHPKLKEQGISIYEN
jgi:hypothetical protein